MEGWISLHRQLLKKGYFTNSKYVHLWIYILLSANHTSSEFLWNGKIMKLKEGQFVTGRLKISHETGIRETTIERILKVLESEHQIGQQKTSKYRLITVLNWNKYQKWTSKRTANGQQTDTNNNVIMKTKNTPASPGLKDKNKPMRTYNENNPQDELPTVDPETGEVASPSKAPGLLPVYKKLCEWAENQTGKKFTNMAKQYRALKEMREIGLTPVEIQEKWRTMQADKFWKDKPFDFMTVRSTVKMK